MTDSFDLIRLADPAAADVEVPETVMAKGALLVLIDEKVTTMPVQTTTKPEPTKQNSRWGIAAAAVAFMIVLLAGAAFALLSQTEDDIPPTDSTVTTTTIELSPEEEAKVARAHEIVQIYNDGDPIVFSNLFQEAASFQTWAVSGSHVQRALAFRMALGNQLTIESCIPLFGGLEDLACSVVERDDLGGDDAARTETLTLGLADNGRVTNFVLNTEAVDQRTTLDMVRWIYETHPDRFDAVLAADCSAQSGLDCVSWNLDGDIVVWRVSAEAAELMLELRDEFLASEG